MKPNPQTLLEEFCKKPGVTTAVASAYMEGLTDMRAAYESGRTFYISPLDAQTLSKTGPPRDGHEEWIKVRELQQ